MNSKSLTAKGPIRIDAQFNNKNGVFFNKDAKMVSLEATNK